ncbi:MAG: serine--tRNA ligase [Oscillospiraceae bacterium]
MLDIKQIRINPDYFKERLALRKNDYSGAIDQLLEIDEKRRVLSSEADGYKAEQNSASKEIPAIKKAGGDVSEIMAKMKEFSEKVKLLDAEISQLEATQRDILLNIPNTPYKDVIKGDSDADNVEVRKWGDPKSFDFEPLAHWDIGANLGILDPERAAKVTGTRFHFYKGLGARLERAVINFYLDNHTKNGYTEIMPPYMVNRASMTGTGQLPKFEEDAFKVADTGYFLIPTAEVPVTNFHRDEILKEDDLPLKYCAYSACFRGEGGSAGRDQRGLIRQHQFNKVELVKFANPENSYEELEKLTMDAEKMLQLLELPYRVVRLCSGDLGFSSAETYDIEVWLPSYNRYAEISSCSNFEDYQARRANIKFKKEAKDKAKFVHTLNGSGLAVGRTVAAILENYQNQDGSVTVPKALIPYMGTDIIK